MNNSNLINKMNDIYFDKLQEFVSKKLNMQYEATNFKLKDVDLKSQIYSSMSIYSLMADCLLEQNQDVNNLKELVKKDIIKAGKSITDLFQNSVANRIENIGFNNLDDYKQSLFNHIQITLTTLKEENKYSIEQERE